MQKVIGTFPQEHRAEGHILAGEDLAALAVSRARDWHGVPQVTQPPGEEWEDMDNLERTLHQE